MTYFESHLPAQELLSHLREMLPVHFGLFDDSNEGVLSTKSIDTSAPTVSRSKQLCCVEIQCSKMALFTSRINSFQLFRVIVL